MGTTIVPVSSLDDFLNTFDRSSLAAAVQAAEAERERVLTLFPLERWQNLKADEYALGMKSDEPSWCYLMEYETQNMGGIGGGSAHKHVIFRRRQSKEWAYPSEFSSIEEAWQSLHGEYLDSFEKAKEGDWSAIDLQLGASIRVKTLNVYFPEEVLPIYSTKYLRHYLRLLGVQRSAFAGHDALYVGRLLRNRLREYDRLKDWSPRELGIMLTAWADPKELQRVVKIAPGHGAKFWDDCLKNGYICVGWDDVGDLREFDSKEDFKQAFGEVFNDLYKGVKRQISKKANEVWTLRELEPGDLVVANKGTAQILGVGTVEDPGYEWRTDREVMRHTVKVRWDTDYAREVEPIKSWATITVGEVPKARYLEVFGGPGLVSAVEPVFLDLDQALQRKGQAVLYGPPGTGKTYHARRFSLWWLLLRAGRQEDAAMALSDPDSFTRLERELSTTQVRRRVWWVVANPKEWSWEELFTDGFVEYDYGRLKRNYSLLQPGDLVIGYQATPDKRIVALAEVERGLADDANGEPKFRLCPLLRVPNGLTYEELRADPLLSESEPLRFNNQGTLFSLTEDEAEYLLSLLIERNQGLLDGLEEKGGIAPLTRITFHPSYSYEDFVEGFRPTQSGEGLSVRLQDGVFKRICREAQANPKESYVLLIDEINRANVAKVFGELITLLEVDKRELLITLPQSQESFAIPPNLFLLGTMNTADRSINLLDAALRRRFAFVELMPDSSLLEGARVGSLPLDEFLDELNRRVAEQEGREKQIGHSFLLQDGEPVVDPEEFARRFRQEILPLLQEYCYSDYTALGRYLGPALVDEAGQSLVAETIGNTEALLIELEKELISKTDAEG